MSGLLQLCTAARDILGSRSIQPNRSFVANGGDSLTAAKVVLALREAGYSVSYVDLLSARPLLALVLTNITTKMNIETNSVLQYELSPYQRKYAARIQQQGGMDYSLVNTLWMVHEPGDLPDLIERMRNFLRGSILNWSVSFDDGKPIWRYCEKTIDPEKTAAGARYSEDVLRKLVRLETESGLNHFSHQTFRVRIFEFTDSVVVGVFFSHLLFDSASLEQFKMNVIDYPTTSPRSKSTKNHFTYVTETLARIKHCPSEIATSFLVSKRAAELASQSLPQTLRVKPELEHLKLTAADFLAVKQGAIRLGITWHTWISGALLHLLGARLGVELIPAIVPISVRYGEYNQTLGPFMDYAVVILDLTKVWEKRLRSLQDQIAFFQEHSEYPLQFVLDSIAGGCEIDTNKLAPVSLNMVDKTWKCVNYSEIDLQNEDRSSSLRDYSFTVVLIDDTLRIEFSSRNERAMGLLQGDAIQALL